MTLTTTGKKTIRAAMKTFDSIPKPNHTTMSGAIASFRHRLQADEIGKKRLLNERELRDDGADQQCEAGTDEKSQHHLGRRHPRVRTEIAGRDAVHQLAGYRQRTRAG